MGTDAHGADPLLAILERLDARLSRLEARLEPALALAEPVPDLVATATDLVDERAAALDAKARLEAAGRLLERVSREDTLDRLERAVDLIDQLPGVLATGTDVVDELAETYRVSDRVAPTLELLEKATRPENLAQLNTALEQLGQAPQLLATVLDIVDARVADVDTESLLGSLQALFRMLADPAVRAQLELAPETFGLAHELQMAVHDARQTCPPAVGPLGLLRALSDPEVQSAVGLGLDIARRVGTNLRRRGPNHPATRALQS